MNPAKNSQLSGFGHGARDKKWVAETNGPNFCFYTTYVITYFVRNQSSDCPV